MFKKIRIYHWSDQAKLTIFIMVVLGFPAVIATYGMLYVIMLTRKKIIETFSSSKKQYQYQVPTAAAAQTPNNAQDNKKKGSKQKKE